MSQSFISFCSLLTKSETSWKRPGEHKVEAKQVLLWHKYSYNNGGVSVIVVRLFVCLFVCSFVCLLLDFCSFFLSFFLSFSLRILSMDNADLAAHKAHQFIDCCSNCIF